MNTYANLAQNRAKTWWGDQETSKCGRLRNRRRVAQTVCRIPVGIPGNGDLEDARQSVDQLKKFKLDSF